MKLGEGFQLRVSEGKHRVFLVRAGFRDVPADRQRQVYASPHLARAQVVCDALNAGMLTRIAEAVRAERKARTEPSS